MSGRRSCQPSLVRQHRAGSHADWSDSGESRVSPPVIHVKASCQLSCRKGSAEEKARYRFRRMASRWGAICRERDPDTNLHRESHLFVSRTTAGDLHYNESGQPAASDRLDSGWDARNSVCRERSRTVAQDQSRTLRHPAVLVPTHREEPVCEKVPAQPSASQSAIHSLVLDCGRCTFCDPAAYNQQRSRQERMTQDSHWDSTCFPHTGYDPLPDPPDAQAVPLWTSASWLPVTCLWTLPGTSASSIASLPTESVRF